MAKKMLGGKGGWVCLAVVDKTPMISLGMVSWAG